MATIIPTHRGDNELLGTNYRKPRLLVLWEAITHADSGEAITIDPSYADKTIQAIGTFGGGLSLALEGSMDGTNFTALHSAGGSIAVGDPIAFTAAGCAVIAQNCLYYRISRTSGSASDVDVYILAATAGS